MNGKSAYRFSIYAGVFSAVAYILAAVMQINVISFLSYEPKDVVITIGGFIFGPIFCFIICFIVSLLELFTVSTTGLIGFFMNFISSVCFSCIAAYIYSRKRSASGAAAGLISGSILMTLAMILWNYLITPIYLGYEREAVAAMLVPIFLPFNLIKSGLNAAFTIILYKPVISALTNSGLVSNSREQINKKSYIGLVISSFFILVTCIFSILVLKGLL